MVRIGPGLWTASGSQGLASNYKNVDNKAGLLQIETTPTVLDVEKGKGKIEVSGNKEP